MLYTCAVHACVAAYHSSNHTGMVWSEDLQPVKTQSDMYTLYMYYVRRKVRIRTILGFSCANLGS